MKVVIAGYEKMLAALISGAKFNNHDILGILRIDRVKYSKFTLFFKDIFNPSSDYSFIKSHKLYDIKAAGVRDPRFVEEIKRLNPDIILVGSWSEKFPETVLNLPKYGVVNCHPSLLPKHRGANPYFWAIYSGDDKTGVTFHQMDKNFDTGKILMQAAFKIEDNITGGALKNKAVKVAELMVGELLDDIEKNKIIPLEQDENEASYDKYPYPGIDVIDFKESSKKVCDRVRGLKPWAYCYCVLKTDVGNGKSLEKVYKIKSAKVIAGEGDISDIRGDVRAPGQVINVNYGKKTFAVKCAEGAVEIRVF